MSAFEGFSHRRKPDGSFDSICRKCFRTVSSAPSERELRTPEREHSCDPVAVSLQYLSRAHSKPPDRSVEAHKKSM